MMYRNKETNEKMYYKEDALYKILNKEKVG